MKYPRMAGTFLAGFTASVGLLATSALVSSSVTFADGPLPPAAPVERSVATPQTTFGLLGETITAQGNYSVEMVGGSIHIGVSSGTAKIQIIGKQEIDLSAGGDILLVPMAS